MKKLPVWGKFLLVAGVVSVAIGATFGGIAIYNSTAIKYGENLSYTRDNSFTNLKPVSFFVNPNNRNLANAILNSDGSKVKRINANWNEKIVYDDVKTNEMSYQDFYQWYIATFNGETPIQFSKAGPIKFVNEYVDAIDPLAFQQYVEWFVENVSWGPDLATLEQFRIAKNVVISGNVITLGSHSNPHKEESEIVFYPDSFYGSLPLYAIFQGRSNSSDKLLSKINSSAVDLKSMNETLAKTLQINTIINYRLAPPAPGREQNNIKNSFRNLAYAWLLKDKPLYIYYVNQRISTTINKQIFLKAKNAVDARQEVLDFDSSIEFNENNLIRTSISDFFTEEKTNFLVDTDSASLQIRLREAILDTIVISHNDYDPYTLKSLESLEFLQNEIVSQFVNFRDWTNIKQYINDEIFFYKDKDLERFFANETAAIDALANKYEKANLSSYRISNLDVEAKNLTISLTNSTDASKTLQFTISATTKVEKELELIEDLMKAVGYVRFFNPFLIAPEGERRDPETNEQIRQFSVYIEAYDGLLDKILRRFPHLLKNLSGEHLVKSINDKGEFEYKVEIGDYKGLNISDRISFLHILKASDENFKGIGTEFLRYVGTHEYGHHITLQSAQDSAESQRGIFGGISTRGGLNAQQFYDKTVIDLYLEARSNGINFSLNSIDDDRPGQFPRFSWKDKNGEEIIETDELIYGEEKAGDIFSVIANPKRRFLQTFETIKEAAKLREQSVADLFLMNSIDFNSGTLNPSISGKAQYFVYEQTTDDNGNVKKLPRFVDASLAQAESFLKDGMGTPITFTNGLPNIVKFKQRADGSFDTIDRRFIVEEVLIRTSDNEPVINVKPGETINQAQAARLSQINNAILQLVDTDYSIGGWNTGASVIDATPTFAATPFSVFQPFFGDTLAYLKKYLSNRFNLNELTSFNILNTTSLTNSAVEGTRDKRVIGKFLNLTNNYPIFFANNGQLSSTVDVGLSYFVDGQERDSVDAHYWDMFNSAVRFSDHKVVEGKTPIEFLDVVDPNAVSYLANPDSKFITENTRFLDVRPEVTVHLGNGIIAGDLIVQLGSVIRAANASGPYSLVGEQNRRQSINIIEVEADNLIASFFKTKTFPTLKDMMEFASIDYSKFAIDATETSRIWDIDYVEGKFNLDRFLPLQSALNIGSSRRNRVSIDVANSLTRQQKANFAMEEFLTSRFNWFLKNVALGKGWNLISNLMHPKFGIAFFKNNDFKLNNPDKTKFQFNTANIYASFKNFLATNQIKMDEGKDDGVNLSEDEILARIDVQDAMVIFGTWAVSIINDVGAEPQVGSMAKVNFSNRPSKDVIDYNEKRLDEDISQKFTDYVFSIAETLTRDYLQISYSPSNEDLFNLPNYITGASEANTGMEYFLETSATSIWINFVTPFSGATLTTLVSARALNFETNSDILKSIDDKISQISETTKRENTKIGQQIYNQYINDLNSKIAKLKIDFKTELDKVSSNIKTITLRSATIDEIVIQINRAVQIEGSPTTTPQEKAAARATIRNLEQERSRIGNQIRDLTQEVQRLEILYETRVREIRELANQYRNGNANTVIEGENKAAIINSALNAFAFEAKDLIAKTISDNTNLNNERDYDRSGGNLNLANTYFGQVAKLNNGFFQDRFQKKIIGSELYDDNGKAIIDQSIRIKDLDNVTTVKDRARAFWIFLLRSYGIGDRTISGILRNKQSDTNFFWGFVTKELGTKIKYLAFENIKTGKIKHLPIFVNNTNNLFYYKHQGDASSKSTLADEGYSSWISDPAIFAKYANAFLIPDGEFKTYFTNDKFEKVEGFSLGSRTSITENGKTSIQSPTRLLKDKDGNIIFRLVDQFNL